MTAQEKNRIKDMETIAYYSGWGGIEIKQLINGYEDYVVYVGNAWYGGSTVHRTKIYITPNTAYFLFRGHRIPLDECIRCR